MKATREYRAWLKCLLRKHGRRNGRLPPNLLDAPRMELRQLKKSTRAQEVASPERLDTDTP